MSYLGDPDRLRIKRWDDGDIKFEETYSKKLDLLSFETSTHWTCPFCSTKNEVVLELGSDKSCKTCRALPISNNAPQTKAIRYLLTMEVSQILHLPPGIINTIVGFLVWAREEVVGDMIDVKDVLGKWYESTIVRADDFKVCVRFNGWPATWDTWHKRSSEDLAPVHTFTRGPEAPKLAHQTVDTTVSGAPRGGISAPRGSMAQNG